jgi:hypothetical protein
LGKSGGVAENSASYLFVFFRIRNALSAPELIGHYLHF